MQDWVDGDVALSKGIIFKATSYVEDGSTYNYRTFASFNRASYKPSLTVDYTLDATQELSNTTYYLNSKQSGKYLQYTSSAIVGKSGLLSSLGTSIRWQLQKVSEGYVIRLASGTTKYLGVAQSGTGVQYVTVSDATLPDRCIWTITSLSNGCYSIKNLFNSGYLVSSGTSIYTSTTLGTAGTSTYNTRCWRLAKTSVYGNAASYSAREMTTGTTISNIVIFPGASTNITINKSATNIIWASADDFTYSVSSTGKLTITSGILTALNRGVVTVTATHKVTGIKIVFEVFVKNAYIDTSDHSTIYAQFESSVGTGYSTSAAYNKYVVEEALKIVLAHDTMITDFCNEYRIPKEFVQSVLFREVWCYSYADDAADAYVLEYYNWKRGYTTTQPTIIKTDSSTGLGQIFASTAIKALNNAHDRGFVTLDSKYDNDNWEDVWQVWNRLGTDDEFNINCCTLVILDCQYEYQDTIPYSTFYDCSESQIKTILARYNGYGDAAADYSELCYVYYQIFKEYNQ